MQSQNIAPESLAPEVMRRLVPENRQLGDTCQLHYYYRGSPDYSRLLFGGRAGAAEINDRRKSGKLLHRRMMEIFPQLEGVKITHSWGGFIAYTFDHMLHMADNDDIYYVAGFCGSGVANANYLGHKTGLKVLGKAEGETAFDSDHPSRSFYSGNPWFLAPAIALKNLQDRLGL
jgi:glycine/D-amino acid oxidase-like deaminating enzyme